MMRKATDLLKKLYTGDTSQDISETLFNTGVITAAQALSGEMTPEELAVSAALGLGGGFAGRHYGGRVGNVVGRQLDQRYPQTMSKMNEDFGNVYKKLGEWGVRPGAEMKWSSSNLGKSPGEGLSNFIGRTYGDNVLQGLIGLGTYGYFNDEPI